MSDDVEDPFRRRLPGRRRDPRTRFAWGDSHWPIRLGAVNIAVPRWVAVLFLAVSVAIVCLVLAVTR